MSLIAQYSLDEKLYFDNKITKRLQLDKKQEQLQGALTRLYTAILRFLSTAHPTTPF